MSKSENSNYTVEDVKIGITNREYLISLLEEIGSMPAHFFISDDTTKSDDYDFIAFFIVLLVELEDDLVMSLARKINFKDFLYIFIHLTEHESVNEELCSKYENDIEKLALEMFVLESKLNYQRLNRPLFQELCSVNYNVFIDTMYELIAQHSTEDDKSIIDEIRKSRPEHNKKEGTLGEFFSYVNKVMNQNWNPSSNILEYKMAVLNGHRMFLKDIILPLAFGMNADVLETQTLEDIIKKYS